MASKLIKASSVNFPIFTSSSPWTRCLLVPFPSSFYRAVLGVVILSVRPSVRHTRALRLIQRTYTGDIFYTTRKGNHSSFLTPKMSANSNGVTPKGVTKERSSRLKQRFSTNIPGTADRLRRCQLSSPVSVINF